MLNKEKASAPTRALAFKGQWKALGLVKGPQAPTADMQPRGTVALVHGDLLDIRQPAPLGRSLGVADVVANHWPFSAQVASDCHRRVPLSDLLELEQQANIPQSWFFCKFVTEPKENVHG